MYIIIVLVKVKTSNYLSKTNEARGWKKIHNPFVSFDIVTFAIYGNITTVIWLSEILQFFQFSKRDISTARCKCTIYIFTYKGIKVVIRTEFINMTVLLPWRLFLKHFLIFYLKLNSIFLVIRNCCISMSEIELFSGELSFDVADLCFPCSYIKIVFHSNLQSITLNKKDDTCPLVDTNLSAWIELSLWRCKRCHEHSMVKFVSTRGYLILPLYVCVTEQVWA